MYLTGAMEILKNRESIDFHALYMGKVSLADSERLKREGVARLEGLRLPTFVEDQEFYRQRLGDILVSNGLSDEMLRAVFANND
uniref:Uncharacterized protein n=1 Tax=Chromera velia CCMP2878 TaxID=1169474 RepID=A0A0G4I315_9ALVE|eukprot:Cvel_35305.t1-p1 / transcript=Cvel_35305.t1 / gene=Cvel_35305 / organism=Chromera_velia_CCMP2878 / gene_product=Uncharacterized protein KIAA0895, putative / transcript_product=Uncharacterized protein KIAA0895, putative / location=Cvel_scaffold6399:263-843(+) / protein_length=83 / sequence_SO=supercontig / SO=protein_coding / is_pseudo=false